MSKKRNYILWLITIFILILSWSLSLIEPQFIHNSINTKQLSRDIQLIIEKVEQRETNLNQISGLEYVVENKDSVIFWSTNKIDFRKLRAISKVGIYTLSNRICLVWKVKKDKNNYTYLIPLKKDFEFENKYLQNTAFAQVYFPKNYIPTNEKTDFVVPLTVNKEGLNIYFRRINVDKLSTFWMYFLFGLFLFSIIGILILSFKTITNSSLNLVSKIGIWVSLMIVVAFILDNQLPFIEHFYLFQPYDFANRYINSLGMLILNSVWLYTFAFYILQLWSKEKPRFSFSKSVILQTIAFVFFLGIIFLIKDIIINSTSNFVDFDNVVLHYQDILLLLIFGVLVLTYVKVLLFILSYTEALNPKTFFRYILILYLPLTVLLMLFDWHLLIITSFVVFSSLLISLKASPYFSKQTVRLVLIFFGSIFVISFVEYISSEKELQNSSLRLENYQTANNRLAEYLLSELDNKLLQDSVLLGLIYRLPETEQKIYDYIQMQYFTGFWSEQRSSDITICASNNLLKDEANDIENCKLFFNRKKGGESRKVDNSHFVVINDYGVDYYLGEFNFIKEVDSSLIDLYIMLQPKEEHKNLGYPTILLSKEVDNKYEQSYYSFAKYIGGQLITHRGKFNYSLEYDFPKKMDNQLLVNKNGYYHLIEKQSEDVYNIISAKQQNIWIFFIILSYVFVLYVGVFYFLELLNFLIHSELSFQNKLKDKLRLSFLGLLIVTFVIIAWAIISKSTELSEQKQKNVLGEKMQSVLVELNHKLSQGDNLDDFSVDYLNYLLIKFSNVFFTDINLYNLSGKLVATSRPEVFEKGLIGDRMNPIAFKNVSDLKKSSFIHREHIGTQAYLSAYVPFKNSKNELVAYLNLPYFAKDKEIKSDVTTLVSSFLNIFVFLFLVTGLFTVFISNRITLPLVVIQQKLKAFSVGRKNETIEYNSKDEIGSLVAEYNRTVVELNKNIELLAQKEREGAWKEMAKQIAHEIKNPLTPMKLSIQHLKYVWKDNHPDKEEKLNNTIDLIVKQIDNLAEIASAFSDFSKMTVAQQSSFNLVDLIRDQIYLYNNEVSIELVYSKEQNYLAFADEKQISRVFQNLLSNAIQAVPQEREVKIQIKISQEEDFIFTQICDNGKGMDTETRKRLFEPNFTTKNSGMGLGLAIVKQIVENNSGNITFETREGEGTCFSLELPKT